MASSLRLDTDHEVQSTLAQIPQDIKTILARFSVDGKTVEFARCPKCGALHPPQKQKDGQQIYPDKCRKKKCSSLLYELHFDGDVEQKRWPRTFVYYVFKDYIAALLSRPDVEAMAEEACRKTLHDIKREGIEVPVEIKLPVMETSDPNKHLNTVFDGQFVRHFCWPLTGKRLFIDAEDEDELRLLFGLNVDAFNPNMLLERGATTSSGIIAMVCLNLPESKRIEKQNIYLAGVIPGPQTPKLTELNRFLKPLIEELEQSWDRGFRLTRTALHPNGRTVRCALALVSNDLPGARKLAQLADHGANWFCSICNLFGRKKLTDTGVNSWGLRDDTILRNAAGRWKAEKDELKRDAIFKTFGVRNSVLWRLKYWKPSLQLVVDPMHNLLEGLVQNHFRTVLQLTDDGVKLAESRKGKEPAFRLSINIPSRITGFPLLTEPVKRILVQRQLLRLQQILLIREWPSQSFSEALKRQLLIEPLDQITVRLAAEDCLGPEVTNKAIGNGGIGSLEHTILLQMLLEWVRRQISDFLARTIH
jgi:hypothetical protein